MSTTSPARPPQQGSMWRQGHQGRQGQQGRREIMSFLTLLLILSCLICCRVLLSSSTVVVPNWNVNDGSSVRWLVANMDLTTPSRTSRTTKHNHSGVWIDFYIQQLQHDHHEQQQQQQHEQHHQPERGGRQEQQQKPQKEEEEQQHKTKKTPITPFTLFPWSHPNFTSRKLQWAPKDTNHPPLPKQEQVVDRHYSQVPLYIQQNCNLTDVDQWMVPIDSWRRRVPAFLVLGAKKAGTTALFATLTSHDQIIPGWTKEHLFFIPMRFPYWSNPYAVGSRVQVAKARNALIQQWYPSRLFQQEDHNNTTYITGEATPDYLLYSEYSAQAILCTIPWVKFIVLLREPVERLFSHYNFLKPKTKKNQVNNYPSFEAWVRKDIELLQNAGVMPHNLSHIPQYMGTTAEREGWHRYQRTAHVRLKDRPVARSLYALQLEDWYRNLRLVGKDPRQDIKVMTSHDLKHEINATNDLVNWLGLPRFPPQFAASKRAMVTTYTTPTMAPPFEKWLHALFAPYNQRLYKLLNRSGIFDDNDDDDNDYTTFPKSSVESPSNI